MKFWWEGAFLVRASGEVTAEKTLMKEQAMQIIWGKSLPGRGINKGNGPGKSVCEARLM